MMKKKRLLKKQSSLTVTREIKNPDTKEVSGDSAQKVEYHEFTTEPAVVSIGKPILLPGNEFGVNRYGSAKISVHFTMPCYVEDFDKTVKQVSERVDQQLLAEADTIKELYLEIIERAGK